MVMRWQNLFASSTAMEHIADPFALTAWICGRQAKLPFSSRYLRWTMKTGLGFRCCVVHVNAAIVSRR
jgi:hypothetical protein